MSLESKVKKVGSVARWAAPYKYVPFEDHLKIARQSNEVRDIFEETDPRYHSELEERLAYHLDHTRQENRRLKYLGATADTLDKALVPVDIVADAAGILAGLGYAVSLGKEILEAPVKIANTVYYAAKTKEFGAIVKDLGYELLSFIVPGSLLDLTNRYSQRVDKYVAKEAVRRFIKEVKARKENKKTTLVDITEEFQKAA